MTWTRLLYIKSMQNALKRVIPNKTLQQLHISKRYQGELRKQFRIAGVPWIYQLNKPKQHHRDRKPKTSQWEKARQERLQKIQKNLAENQKKIIQFRQEKLDNKPLGGIDKIIGKALPSFIKGDTQDVPQYLKRRQSKSQKDDEL